MQLQTKFTTNANVEEVWKVIMNPELVGKSIPGCDSVQMVDEVTYNSQVEMKVAYLKVRFNLTSKIIEQQPPFRIVTHTQGQGLGLVGNVSQTAEVELRALENGQTEVINSVDLTISGKLANLGQRIIKSKSEEMADEWAKNMKQIIEANAQESNLCRDAI
ncbi:MAG: SRPBCC domain-containing protein [Thermincola sp.]|jgi:carbon monoxide dehydrogenase subunit G|nr:SRPBCC domain-containing protein [Thermincola sp.]MDT3702602.1 SRPBCC domain-containing protein [Thermincola sp.]